jgi:hypothetical protein
MTSTTWVTLFDLAAIKYNTALLIKIFSSVVNIWRNTKKISLIHRDQSGVGGEGESAMYCHYNADKSVPVGRAKFEYSKVQNFSLCHYVDFPPSIYYTLTAISSGLSGWSIQLISHVNQMTESVKYSLSLTHGHAVAQFVEALRYKPEGRGCDSRWCHWNLSLT